MYGLINNCRSPLSINPDPATALAADRSKADNILSWQMPHGGFDKTPARDGDLVAGAQYIVYFSTAGIAGNFGPAACCTVRAAVRWSMQ